MKPDSATSTTRMEKYITEIIENQRKENQVKEEKTQEVISEPSTSTSSPSKKLRTKYSQIYI